MTRTFDIDRFNSVQEQANLARVGSVSELGGHAVVLRSELHPDYPHDGPYITGTPKWTIKGEVDTLTAAAALATLVEYQGRIFIDKDERETLARYLEHVAAGLRQWPPCPAEDTPIIDTPEWGEEH